MPKETNVADVEDPEEVRKWGPNGQIGRNGFLGVLNSFSVTEILREISLGKCKTQKWPFFYGFYDDKKIGTNDHFVIKNYL